MILGNHNPETYALNINGEIIPSLVEVKLLGIIIDHKLKFKKHIDHLCKKGSYKLYALKRIRRYLTVEKERLHLQSHL